jgi:hypothetical protein
MYNQICMDFSYLVCSVEDGDGILGDDNLRDLLPLLTAISYILVSCMSDTS